MCTVQFKSCIPILCSQSNKTVMVGIKKEDSDREERSQALILKKLIEYLLLVRCGFVCSIYKMTIQFLPAPLWTFDLRKELLLHNSILLPVINNMFAVDHKVLPGLFQQLNRNTAYVGTDVI